MSNTIFRARVLAVVLTLTLGGAFASSALASHIDFDARRAERAAEREARKLEREAERTDEDAVTCTCSASLSYAKPSLSFGSAGLVLTPRVNVDVRLKGDQAGPKHNISVKYEGTASYESDDVTPPADQSFSGEKTVFTNAACEGKWKFAGIELERITLSGITRTLLSGKQELDGLVKLKTAVAGCGFAEENRQFSFRVIGAGNLKVNGWRSSR